MSHEARVSKWISCFTFDKCFIGRTQCPQKKEKEADILKVLCVILDSEHVWTRHNMLGIQEAYIVSQICNIGFVVYGCLYKASVAF